MWEACALLQLRKATSLQGQPGHASRGLEMPVLQHGPAAPGNAGDVELEESENSGKLLWGFGANPVVLE